ncbi:MAG: type III-B CRISPR module RAMP protein Cmr4 [Ignisphaera sp.]|uniref:Type III-B CRISPR module RAMP protein Cmr4 n=1 Tax=Ignisphaera aggregans TaxID=334771 RepID=A0A7J3MZT3_9CREN
MYSEARLLYVKAYTPLHVGVGRGEKAYVDLPIQRDEYGYPVIWSSSLKGAIKANLDSSVRPYLGSEPGEPLSKPSAVVFLDARLLLIPVRVIDKVWAYATSINLLNVFNKYVEALNSINKQYKLSQLDLSTLSGDKAIVSKKALMHNGRVMINEMELEAKVCEKILETIRLADALPQEIKTVVEDRGLVILPDRENMDLRIINRSIIIQHRVRLKREEKVVEGGGLWSEEYVPMESVFASVILCRDTKHNNVDKKAPDVCKDIASSLSGRFIYVGGKESIGKGLVKLYTTTT